MPIATILDYLSGNSGLTEEKIYQSITVEGQRYIVLSGSTQEENIFGAAPRYSIDGKELKTFEDKAGILVVRKGKAGSTSFIKEGKYMINDDAYILYLKAQLRYEISLKWLMIQYRDIFYEYASSSDNEIWNMTRLSENVKIDIPLYDEQIELVRKHENLERIENQLRKIRSKFELLLTKQIVASSHQCPSLYPIIFHSFFIGYG